MLNHSSQSYTNCSLTSQTGRITGPILTTCRPGLIEYDRFTHIKPPSQSCSLHCCYIIYCLATGIIVTSYCTGVIYCNHSTSTLTRHSFIVNCFQACINKIHSHAYHYILMSEIKCSPSPLCSCFISSCLLRHL